MTASAAHDVAVVLQSKATLIHDQLAAHLTTIDSVSDQTWYGIPESIIDDLKQAIDLCTLSYNKIAAIVGETSI